MSVRKRIVPAIAAALLLSLAACGSGRQTAASEPDGAEAVQTSIPEPAAADHAAEPEPDSPEGTDETQDDREEQMRFFIGDTELSVAWEDNGATAALMELVKTEALVVEMSMYGGFEQVGALGTALPDDDEQITTEAGDIVLYAGNKIVVFYGSNTWAYTRLGKITGKSAAEIADLLDGGGVTITISYGG